jgi:hypothetical protein
MQFINLPQCIHTYIAYFVVKLPNYNTPACLSRELYVIYNNIINKRCIKYPYLNYNYNIRLNKANYRYINFINKFKLEILLGHSVIFSAIELDIVTMQRIDNHHEEVYHYDMYYYDNNNELILYKRNINSNNYDREFEPHVNYIDYHLHKYNNLRIKF